MVSLFKYYKWTHAAVLATNSNYGSGLAQAFISRASSNGIQILTSQIYSSGSTDYSYEMQTIKASKARIIIIMGYDTDVVALLASAKAAGIWGSDYVYIGSDGVYSIHDNLYASSVNVTAQVAESRALVQGLIISGFYEHGKDFYFNSLNAKFAAAYSGKAPLVYNYFLNDCLLSLAAGFNHLITSNGSTIAQINNRTIPNFNLTDFLSANFESASGYIKYDTNGDGNTPIVFSNIVNGKIVDSILIDNLGNATVFAPMVFAGNSKSVPISYPIYKHLQVSSDSPLSIVLTIIAIIGVLTCVGTIGYIALKRKERFILPISPYLVIIICSALVVLFSSVFLSLVPTLTENSCLAEQWLENVSITLFLAVILAKALRIFVIFDNPVAARNSAMTSTPKVIMIILLMTSITVILEIIWMAMDPLKPQQIVLDSQLSYFYECHSSDAMNESIFSGLITAYQFLLLLIALYLAYRTKDVYSEFSESKFIGITVQNVLLSKIFILVIQSLLNGTEFYAQIALILLARLYMAFFVFSAVVFRPLLRAYLKDKTKDRKSSALTSNHTHKVSRPDDSTMKSGVFDKDEQKAWVFNLAMKSETTMLASWYKYRLILVPVR